MLGKGPPCHLPYIITTYPISTMTFFFFVLVHRTCPVNVWEHLSDTEERSTLLDMNSLKRLEDIHHAPQIYQLALLIFSVVLTVHPMDH